MRHAPPPLRTLGLLLAVALAACGSAHRDRGFDLGSVVSGRVAFRCDDNRRFTVAFEQGGRYATVNTTDRSYYLAAEGDQNRSSYRSDDGVAQLDLNGDRAHLQIKNGRDYKGCEAQWGPEGERRGGQPWRGPRARRPPPARDPFAGEELP